MTLSDTPLWTPKRIVILALILGAWFAVAALIGVGGLFTNPSGGFMAPIAVTAAVPVAVFMAAYWLSGSFRRFVLAQDIEALTTLQHWRVVGFAFLLLWAHGVLPAVFALFAGLGDVAIGLAAPFVMRRLREDPGYAQSAGFRRYHYLGLLDFAVAVAAAGLTAGFLPVLTSAGVTSAAMDVWPLNLFPSLIVPAFIILHLNVLLKLRAERTVHMAAPVAV
ncbi:MAG: hypothetical protein OEN23_02835 [Paracoccaceae bacterium]|nr:hypothetical protein [Paracoccaceae bacterium]